MRPLSAPRVFRPGVVLLEAASPGREKIHSGWVHPRGTAGREGSPRVLPSGGRVKGVFPRLTNKIEVERERSCQGASAMVKKDKSVVVRAESGAKSLAAEWLDSMIKDAPEAAAARMTGKVRRDSRPPSPLSHDCFEWIDECIRLRLRIVYFSTILTR